MAQVKIDTGAMRAWIKREGMTLQEVSEKIGRCRTYIGVCLAKGSMVESAYRMFCGTFGLPRSAFIPAPCVPEKPQSTEGYTIGMDVKPDRVRLCVKYDGVEVHHAHALIKGDTEIDLLQAVSYAAHMIYKLAQQNVLGGDEK